MTDENRDEQYPQRVEDVQALFLVPVDTEAGGHGWSLISRAAASIDVERWGHLGLGQLLSGLENLPGNAPATNIYPSGIRNTIGRRMPSEWASVSGITLNEVYGWPTVGIKKLATLIAFLAEHVDDARNVGTDSATMNPDAGLADALRSLAAWGVASGYGDLLSALGAAASDGQDKPERAISAIQSVDMRELAGDRLVWWDVDVAAQDLLERLDEHELAILTARVLTGTRKPGTTLEKLGERYDVTRERIRQVEKKAVRRLENLLLRDRYRALHRAAQKLRSQIGAARPVAAVEDLVKDDPDSLVDELLLWMAGSYHRADGWVLRCDSPSIETLVLAVFDDVAARSVVGREELFDALEERGMAEEHLVAALEATETIDEFEGFLVRWPGTTARRAIAVLEVRGVPMTTDELFALQAKVTNRASFSNALHNSNDIVRVGLRHWGLRVWGADAYPGIVPAMVEALEERGPLPVELLGDELAERFGVSPVSVSINAQMHPGFVFSDGVVSLRPEDQPYLPKADLVDTPRCFVVDGAWALRILVDRDVLRGSGRKIPEAFAVHIGVGPLKSGRMEGPARHVSFGWTQHPTIGSIRANVEVLGLTEGDLVFVRRASADSISFVGVHKADLDHASPSRKLRMLVGADPDDPRESHVVLAEAVGMGLATPPPVAAVVARLQSRGDNELADLLEALVAE